MTEQPVPCDWCGNVPAVERGAGYDWTVECQCETCPVGPSTVGIRGRDNAVRVWNTRATQSPEPPTCDYRDSRCAATGHVVNSKWTCANHALQGAHIHKWEVYGDTYNGGFKCAECGHEMTDTEERQEIISAPEPLLPSDRANETASKIADYFNAPPSVIPSIEQIIRRCVAPEPPSADAEAVAKRIVKRYLDNDTNDHQLLNEIIAAIRAGGK